MELSKEQFEKLNPYERHLERAYYGGYIYALTKAEYEDICSIYNEFFHKNETTKTSCGTCRMRVCKLLGQYYFQYKEKNNNTKKGKKKNEPKTK